MIIIIILLTKNPSSLSTVNSQLRPLYSTWAIHFFTLIGTSSSSLSLSSSSSDQDGGNDADMSDLKSPLKFPSLDLIELVVLSFYSPYGNYDDIKVLFLIFLTRTFELQRGLWQQLQLPRLPGPPCCQRQSRGKRHPENYQSYHDDDQRLCCQLCHGDEEDYDYDNDDDESDDDNDDDLVDLLATVSNAYAVLLSLVYWGSMVYQPCLQINTGVNMIIIRTMMIIIKINNNAKSFGQ